jgi:ABC-type nitrate/sulfonate/bicarbonate transport system substrate-binding protein
MQRSSPSFLFRALTLGLALLSASWAQAAEPFRLADTGILLYGLATLAEVQGDFKSQGLDLRRVPIVTGQDGLKALQSGQADAYLAADVAAAGQLQSEPGLRILASVGEWDNDDRVLARRDRGITRVEDLAGKRVGVQRGTSFHFLLDRLLARQGLTEADVRLVPMHTRDQLDALAQGKLDAIATRNSFQARAEALLGANLQVLDSKGVMVKSVLLITREDILRRRGDDFVALLRALNQAEQRARADLAGTAATLSAPMGETPEKLRALLKEARLTLTLDEHLLLSLEKIERWQRRQAGKADQPASNFLDKLEPRFLRAVKPMGVTLQY